MIQFLNDWMTGVAWLLVVTLSVVTIVGTGLIALGYICNFFESLGKKNPPV